jgi:hypothetical protein
LPQKEFNKFLLAAVEESLSALGDSSKEAIFYHLETSFNLKREGIPSNMNGFAKALERIFGPGADYLEKLIEQRLYAKLGLSLDQEHNDNFLSSLNAAKRQLLITGECAAP